MSSERRYHLRCSIEVIGLDVRSVNGGVATCNPTEAVTDEGGVVDIANKKVSERAGAMHLSMAFQAKVRVSYGQQFGVD